MPDINYWACKSETMNNIPGDPEHVTNRQMPPIGQQLATIGDGTVNGVLFVRTLNLNLHCVTDDSVPLPRVFVVGGLAINQLSRHAVQAN